jgi:aspartyl-tRNA synthetase
MELVDLREEFRASSFRVFSGAVLSGGVVRPPDAKGAGRRDPRPDRDHDRICQEFRAKGLAYIKVENGEWKSPIVKFFSGAEKNGN